MGLGGAILVYALFKIIIDIGTHYGTYSDLQMALPANVFGGFIAFLLIGFGLWLIIHDRPITKVNPS